MFLEVISGYYVMPTHKDGESLSHTTVDISRYRCHLLTSRSQTTWPNDQNPRRRNRYGVKGTLKCKLCRERKRLVNLIALLAIVDRSASFRNQAHHVRGVYKLVNLVDQNNPQATRRSRGITMQRKNNYTKT